MDYGNKISPAKQQRYFGEIASDSCGATEALRGPFTLAGEAYNALAELQTRFDALADKLVGPESSNQAKSDGRPPPMGIFGAVEQEARLARSRIDSMHKTLSRIESYLT